MDKLEAGNVVTLTVARQADFGYFLTNENEDVLLHNREITGTIEIEEEIEVFLYKDKQDRLAATMTIPEIKKGTFGWAEVIEIKPNIGVFVNIGINKEIPVSKDDLPFLEKVWPEKGALLFITLTTDKKGRMWAKLAEEDDIQSITKRAPKELLHQSITGRVYRPLKIGTFVLSEEGYRCFIHESQRRKEPKLGEVVTGRVTEVKEDGSLNVTLLPLKQEGMETDAEQILAYLKKNGGTMPYSDKSDPEKIKREFHMSKAAFKRALGKLMKEKKVIQENGITKLQH